MRYVMPFLGYCVSLAGQRVFVLSSGGCEREGAPSLLDGERAGEVEEILRDTTHTGRLLLQRSRS